MRRLLSLIIGLSIPFSASAFTLIDTSLSTGISGAANAQQGTNILSTLQKANAAAAQMNDMEQERSEILMKSAQELRTTNESIREVKKKNIVMKKNARNTLKTPRQSRRLLKPIRRTGTRSSLGN